MTGDPRIYCLYELVRRADELRANEIRLEASPRGVRMVYLRDKRVIDVNRIPSGFFRGDAPEPHQSPVKFLAQYSLAYDLCLQHEEEDAGQRGAVVHIRANSPLNHVPVFTPGFTGPPTPQRSVEVSAAITKSVVTFSLLYTCESTPPPWEERSDGRRGDEGSPRISAIEDSVPERESAPCPYCGKALRTPMAKQCRFCKMDWHDPDNVHRRG